MDLRFTNAGRIAITVLAVFIITEQQCTNHRLNKELLSKPAPIIEHIKVYDTIRPEPVKEPTYEEGKKFYYKCSGLKQSDTFEYITTILYHKNDLARLPIGKNKEIEVTRILTDPEPIKN